MKNHENLNGTLVLVHPELQDDPARQQGKVGFVTYAREADDINVGFTGGTEGVYKTQDLLLLKGKTELMQALNDHGARMEVEDFKNLYKIMMLEDRGTPTARFNALEIAAKSPALWDKVLTQAAPARELEESRGYGR